MDKTDFKSFLKGYDYNLTVFTCNIDTKKKRVNWDDIDEGQTMAYSFDSLERMLELVSFISKVLTEDLNFKFESEYQIEGGMTTCLQFTKNVKFKHYMTELRCSPTYRVSSQKSLAHVRQIFRDVLKRVKEM